MAVARHDTDRHRGGHPPASPRLQIGPAPLPGANPSYSSPSPWIRPLDPVRCRRLRRPRAPDAVVLTVAITVVALHHRPHRASVEHALHNYGLPRALDVIIVDTLDVATARASSGFFVLLAAALLHCRRCNLRPPRPPTPAGLPSNAAPHPAPSGHRRRSPRTAALAIPRSSLLLACVPIAGHRSPAPPSPAAAPAHRRPRPAPRRSPALRPAAAPPWPRRRREQPRPAGLAFPPYVMGAWVRPAPTRL
nr:vegetative cell wall protein gp1-like [Aegilops tauschii subsp. strangulata]